MLLAGLAVAGAECSRVRTETFLIPEGRGSGWCVVMHNRPGKPKVSHTAFGDTFAFPDSGVLCTSEPIDRDWSYTRYFLVRADGTRVPLELDSMIWQAGAFQIGNAGSPCAVEGVHFFYGSREALRRGPADTWHASAVRECAPECVSVLQVGQ